MGFRWLVWAALVGCYSPRAPAGAPCGPGGDCPTGLSCETVAGEDVCVERAIDGGIDPDGPSPTDSPITTDVPSDAPQTDPWTLVRTRDKAQSSTLSVPSIGAGHLVIVGIESAMAATAVVDDGGNVYQRVASSRAEVPSEQLGVELWYVPNALPGGTTIAVTAPSTVFAIDMWEVDGLASVEIDDVATLDDQPATTTPEGASITTTTDGEFVVSIAIVNNFVGGLTANSQFTNDHTTFGNGWAHLTSNTAPAGTYQARWNQSVSGTYCASSVAFRSN